MRFYQSLIDREQMPSGEFEYNKLPKTIIILVTDFDLFKKGLYRYTFENVCREDFSVTLGDESLKVVLNTQGKDRTGIKPELIELLEYFHSSTVETAEKASSDIVKRIDKMLNPIKNSPKFGGDFMSYEEKIYTERSEARQEGIQEGRREERQKTIEAMRKLGISEEQIKAIYGDRC